VAKNRGVNLQITRGKLWKSHRPMDSSGSTLVKCPPKSTALSALQKQVWSKKGRETEIKKNIYTNVKKRRSPVMYGLSPSFNTGIQFKINHCFAKYSKIPLSYHTKGADPYRYTSLSKTSKRLLHVDRSCIGRSPQSFHRRSQIFSFTSILLHHMDLNNCNIVFVKFLHSIFAFSRARAT